jgi:redox-sensitive bicupin YhaK (pirin superfamily)
MVATLTPLLSGSAAVSLDLPEGHIGALVVLSGRIRVNGSHPAGEAEMVLLSRNGRGGIIGADSEATVLVLTGEPIDEPVVGHGPLLMNTAAEIR